MTGEYGFGPFRLLPAQQLLLEDGKPVRLGSRARELLHALVESAGEVVSKDALHARLWPDVNVEEATLRVHIAALRKALGDGHDGRRFIASIAGRGYSFVAEVVRAEADAAAAPPVAAALPSAFATKLFGRAEVIAKLSADLAAGRITTVVGPGGIGKTTVAGAVADRLRGQLRDGVCFVDLAPLSDGRFVAPALASALGLAVIAEQPLPGLVAALREREVLVVLDNCEHVIDEAATLAEAMLKGAPDVRILATSREPLGIDGEKLCRLAPLAVPEPTHGLTAATALDYPAVQLFVERARQRLDGFLLTDDEAALVASICRRLDGVALAIEIAAGRIDAFGVAGLAAVLDDRFHLAMRGRRTAMPRQQTLTMAMDWSYQLLLEEERVLLRRLAVFAGTFTVADAVSVLADTPEERFGIVDAIAMLVEKSLLQAHLGAPVAVYRLLETTRAYAMQKLVDAGEQPGFARRHALHYQTLLEAARAEWRTVPAPDWLARYRHAIDNARAALEWSLSQPEAASIAVALTVAMVPLWFQLSLLSECCRRVQQALALPEGSRNAGQALRLYAALAWSLMQTKGSVRETQEAWSRLLQCAREAGDVDYQLRALWGMWAAQINAGRFRQALTLAEEFLALAESGSTRSDSAVGHRMVGYVLHLLGDQPAARTHIERMLADYVRPSTGAEMIRFVFDQDATARCFLARIQWLQGFPDQAVRTSQAVLRATEAGGDVLSLCQVLVQAAIPVGLLVGDLAAVARHVTTLTEAAQRNDWRFWSAYARGFRGVLLLSEDDAAAGLALLEQALDDLRSIEFGVYYVPFLSQHAAALGRIGEVARGLDVIGEALARAETNEERWYLAELWRLKGELLERRGDTAEADAAYATALDWAERQAAPSWALRAATSLARLRHTQAGRIKARALLKSVLDRFSEGEGTADHRAARSLLAALAR